jgi:hypothetical protein
MTSRKVKWTAVIAAALLLVAASMAMAQSSYTGTYRGTFIGDDYGWFVVEVEPGGTISGTVHSNVALVDLEVQGRWELDGDSEFMTIGEETPPIYFLGKIDFMNRFLGKWSYDDHSGRGSFYGILQKD